MMIILKILTASILTFSLLASVVFAKSVTCEFTSWKGATDEDATISWIGTGFIADEKKGTIIKVWPDGKSDPIGVEVVPIDKFTSFNYTQREEDNEGSKFSVRYGYRIYKNGKCDASLTPQGYTAMFGYGRVK